MLDFIRPQKRFPLAVTRHALRGGTALCVAHLTDLHLEDGANAAWLKRLVRIVNAQHPDIICFTGDFACRRAQFATADVYCSILRGMRARYGKFAVTGNHDILGAAGKAPQLICRAGFTLLQNEAARVEISGQNVDILGLSTMKYDTPATAKRRFPLKGQQPGPAFRLGLVHEPAAVQLLPASFWPGTRMRGSFMCRGWKGCGCRRVPARMRTGFIRRPQGLCTFRQALGKAGRACAFARRAKWQFSTSSPDDVESFVG